MRSTSASFCARAIVPASPQRAPSLIRMVAATHVGECEPQGESEELPASLPFASHLPVIFEERDRKGNERGCILAPVAGSLYWCGHAWSSGVQFACVIEDEVASRSAKLEASLGAVQLTGAIAGTLRCSLSFL
jgi:hypothetical protein